MRDNCYFCGLPNDGESLDFCPACGAKEPFSLDKSCGKRSYSKYRFISEHDEQDSAIYQSGVRAMEDKGYDR